MQFNLLHKNMKITSCLSLSISYAAVLDNPRGALMALKAEMQKEGRVKTRTSLD